MRLQLSIRLIICLFLFLTATYFTSSAQSKKVPFNTSTIDPGAEGTVKVKKDKNGNFNIDIEINNLADPSKLTPAKKEYIVWLETEKGAKNIGQIHSSGSLLSKAKKASFSTVSPYKPVRIFISAEDDPGLEQPGNVIVLTTNNF
ncbi:MAG: hypothetical protein C5B59_06235 [Bacteroidetes bacterium]|nr:MAG: hypothetical protein C5B59_06235 [Bacteroidota bacterium]